MALKDIRTLVMANAVFNTGYNAVASIYTPAGGEALEDVDIIWAFDAEEIRFERSMGKKAESGTASIQTADVARPARGDHITHPDQGEYFINGIINSNDLQTTVKFSRKNITTAGDLSI